MPHNTPTVGAIISNREFSSSDSSVVVLVLFISLSLYFPLQSGLRQIANPDMLNTKESLWLICFAIKLYIETALY